MRSGFVCPIFYICSIMPTRAGPENAYVPSNPRRSGAGCLSALGSATNAIKGDTKEYPLALHHRGPLESPKVGLTNMKAKTDPPTESQDPRAEKRKPRVDRRSGRSLDKSSSWRSELPAEFRNLSREELLALSERNLCRYVGVSDPHLANRLLRQAILMRTFGEPDGCNLGKPDVEAFALLGEFAPNNIMESMLAAQMSGAHEAALAFLKAAGEPGLSQRQRDGEVRRAKQLLQVFNSQLGNMMKLKNQDWVRRGPAGTTPVPRPEAPKSEAD